MQEVLLAGQQPFKEYIMKVWNIDSLKYYAGLGEMPKTVIEPVNESLQNIDGKWSLVSPEGKKLRVYLGEGKPSKVWLENQEKSVEYFKNLTESEICESQRLMGKLVSNDDTCVAKIYKDTEWDQFIVRYERNGEQLFNDEESDGLGYADSKEDALGQAQDFIDRVNRGDTQGLFDSVEGNTDIEVVLEKKDESGVSEPPKVEEPEKLKDSDENSTQNTGKSQDDATSVKVPAGLMASIDKRMKEIEASKDQYDKVKYMEQNSGKDKAIDCLKHFKELLADCNVAKHKEANIYFSGISSNIYNLFPQSLVKFLHSAETLYKPIDSPIYPQVAKSKDKPD